MICIGIDISKGKSTVCFLKPYGEVIHKPYEIKHTESDLKHLVEQISTLTEEARVVMEATGSYHYPVLAYLKEYGVFVSVINPLVMRKYANLSIRKGKTDKLDAIKIANFGLDHWFHLAEYTPTTEVYNELKTLNRQYLNYISMRIQAKLSLANLLDRTMPGIKTQLWNRSDAPDRDKLNDFVKEYWHFDNITQMSEANSQPAITTGQKRRDTKTTQKKRRKSTSLHWKVSLLCLLIRPSTKMLVLEAIKVLHMIDTTLALILLQMSELAKTLKEYEIVMNMPGVGKTLGPRLIAEVGDVFRYHSASALIAYAGLDAPPFQPGNYTAAKRSISKRGSVSLRKTGYEIMQHLKVAKPREDNAVYLYMIKKENEGKPLRVSKIAALNKFLRIYYARVKEAYISA